MKGVKKMSEQNTNQNNNNNYYVKLPNDWYTDKSITNEELVILYFLYRNFMLYKSLSLCSLDMIASDYMLINTSNNKKIINTIKNTIKSLLEKGKITNIFDLKYNPLELDSITNKNQLLYLQLINPPNDNYFEVKDADIDNLLVYLQNENINKFSFIRYFIACVRVTHNQDKFGYLTQSKAKIIAGHSSTIRRYNKILQDELHLIRYNNDYLTKEKKYCTTFIGCYDDEEFNLKVQQKVHEMGLVYTDKQISNKKRSIQQKKKKVKDDDIDRDKRIQELEEELKKYRNMLLTKKKSQPKQKPKIIEYPLSYVEDEDIDIDDLLG
jgi:hypothetical protein